MSALSADVTTARESNVIPKVERKMTTEAQQLVDELEAELATL